MNPVLCFLLLAICADDKLPPYKRLLDAAQAKRVAEMQNESASLTATGKLDEAEKLAKEVLQIRAVNQGKDHWETVNARIALEFSKRVRHDMTSEHTSHPEISKLQEEVTALLQKEKYAQAEPLLQKILDARRKLWGEIHLSLARTNNELGHVRNGQSKFAEAQPYYENARAIYSQVLGEAHPYTARGYANVGDNLIAQAQYAKAQPYLEKALTIYRQALGEMHPDTAKSYDLVANNWKAQGEYDKAQPLYDKALELYQRTLGEMHVDTASVYDDLATNLLAQGKSADAQPLLEKALGIRRKLLGEVNHYTAASYNNVAINLIQQGFYPEAEEKLEKALAIHRQLLGEDHYDTATCYKNLATALNSQGKYAEAQPLYEKALEIYVKTLGENHPHTAHGYNGVAVNLNAQGRFAEAGPNYEKAYANFREILGEKHPHTALAYSNLAANLNAQGRYSEAQSIYEKALAMYRQALGESHRSVGMAYNNMGANLNAQRKYAQAQEFYDKALAINLKALGESHPDTAHSYTGVAINLNAQGKYVEAQPAYEKALAIRRKVLGEHHPHTGSGYNNMASNLRAQGKPSEAQAYFEKAVAISQQALGESHPETAHYCTNLALTLHAQGKTREAIPLLEMACRAAERARLPIASTGFQRAQYRTDWTSPHAALASALASLQEPSNAWRSAEFFLARGLLDDLDPESRKAVSAPARLARLEDQLIGLLARPKLRPEQFMLRESLRRETQALRKAVTDAAAERASKRVWALERVQATLTAETAIVFWLDVKPDHWACVVRQSGQPIWQRLEGTEADKSWNPADEGLAQRAYAAIATPNHPDRDRLVSALRVQRLDPVMPHLQGIRHLLLVATGEMAKVPLEALSDQLTISYIPSASVYGLLRQTHRPLDGQSLLALGDPVLRPPAEDVRSTYASIPGTKVEVEALAGLVPQAKLLLGSAASEQTLEQLAETGQLKNYRLMHFATHGAVNEGIPTESALILAQDQVSDKLSEQLTRTLSHKKPLDGRLTVGTILSKWKLDADQVVLSACETGLGAQAGGEGLLGFAQALLQSGARSVVLSRWKVPDEATSLLMQRYYQNILGKREGLKAPMRRAEGLREAKQWLRNLTQAEKDKLVLTLPGGRELRGSVKQGLQTEIKEPAATDHPFAAPYYWAALVLIGDPD